MARALHILFTWLMCLQLKQCVLWLTNSWAFKSPVMHHHQTFWHYTWNSHDNDHDRFKEGKISVSGPKSLFLTLISGGVIFKRSLYFVQTLLLGAVFVYKCIVKLGNHTAFFYLSSGTMGYISCTFLQSNLDLTASYTRPSNG